MSVEILKDAAVDRLELEYRNLLQVALMEMMLGEKRSVVDESDWVKNYGPRVSELVDHHEHDEVRDLARQGNYRAAAELLAKILPAGV